MRKKPRASRCGWGRRLRVLHYPKGMRLLRMRANSRWLVGAYYGYKSGSAVVWDIDSGKQLCKFSTSDGGLFSAEVSPDGKTMVTAANGGQVKVWKLGRKTAAAGASTAVNKDK